MHFSPLEPDPPVDIRDLRVFRAENFPKSEQLPWLDRADWREQVERKRLAGTIDAQQAAWCTQWAEHGYLIVKGMFDPAQLDDAWRNYEARIADETVLPLKDYGIDVDLTMPGRTLNPHVKLPAFDALLRQPSAVSLVSMLLGVAALPFQTIAGHRGTQQRAHSDSIHMTTYPQGYLVANWIAFEDIAADSGPLEYYPGSHRLPYVYSRDCAISLEEARSGYGVYHSNYETHVQRIIRENNLQPEHFHARKGDVLFWHANLLHGGSIIANKQRSRHALVCHFFAQGCVCYHDFTGTPSYLTEFPKLERHQFDPEIYLRLNPDIAAAGVDPYEHYVTYGFNEKRAVR